MPGILKVPLLLLVVATALTFHGQTDAAQPAKADYIVVLKENAGDPRAVASKHAKRHGGEVGHVYKHALKGYSATLTAAGAQSLSQDAAVAYVTPDREVKADAVPAEDCINVAECQLLTRGIKRIDGELSSTLSGDGLHSVDINIAVIDSGIDSTHPDLNVVGGTNCTKEKGPPKNPHGTIVAGIIGARDNQIGVVGVAPGARLWSVRVLKKNNGGTLKMILCGYDWVTSTRRDADPTNDIQVANVSIGGPGADDRNCGLTNKDPEHQALCASIAAGVTYVVSAGNEGADLATFTPAAYDEVLTATAITDTDGEPGALLPPADSPGECMRSFAPDGYSDDSAAAFSNFSTGALDRGHTVAAPGVCAVSTYLWDPAMPNQLGVASGTSFAAPHISGVVALCIASGDCAGLTPAQIIQKIVADAAAYNTAHPEYGFTGDPLRPVPGKYYGHLIRAAEY
jgi:subtilisin family serine protease